MMTAENIYEAHKAGEPVTWGQRQVDTCLAMHDLDNSPEAAAELATLLQPVRAGGRIDAWLLLEHLGY